VRDHPEDREDLLGAYALGTLSRGERWVLGRLLSRRPELRREARELRETAGLLALAGPAHEPPPGLGERVLLEAARLDAAADKDQARHTGLRRWYRGARLTRRRALVGLACAALRSPVRLAGPWQLADGARGLLRNVSGAASS